MSWTDNLRTWWDRIAKASPASAEADDTVDLKAVAGPSLLDSGEPLLTIIMPTKNRPAQCAAQLRFFRDCRVRHRMLVADSSDAAEAALVRKACKGIAEYRYFDPTTRVTDKWGQVVSEVTTPFVVMTPDDDITFPHAIDAALQSLIDKPDYAAAHGHVLRFGTHYDHFDIHGVFSFTPSITDDDPLRRHYQLMRRYQPFIWAVFRTPIFAEALRRAAMVEGAIFQEVAFMNTAVLHGKVMRLPNVYAMRGSAESLSAKADTDPLFWYLKNANQFFGLYGAYRIALSENIRAMNIRVPNNTDLTQLLDLVHGAWLGRAVDVGIINHSARILLGDALDPIQVPPEWAGWRAIEATDVVHKSAAIRREYVWREAVAAAEPRDEIDIGAMEMASVERQLDFYRFS